MKNFFVARHFSPNACRYFSKYINSSGDVNFRMYVSEEKIQYETEGYRIFLPSSILNPPYRFGKIDAEKKLILQFSLSQEEFEQLIISLGGSFKRINPVSSQPKLGDLLKL